MVRSLADWHRGLHVQIWTGATVGVIQRIPRTNAPRKNSGLLRFEGQGNRNRPRNYLLTRSVAAMVVAMRPSSLPGLDFFSGSSW